MSSPEQNWSLIQDWGSALQAAHASHEVLCVPHMEALYPHTCRECVGVKAKGFRFATVMPWFIGIRHIHEVFVVLFFADNIRALTESFWLNVSRSGEPHSSTTRQISMLIDG